MKKKSSCALPTEEHAVFEIGACAWGGIGGILAPQQFPTLSASANTNNTAVQQRECMYVLIYLPGCARWIRPEGEGSLRARRRCPDLSRRRGACGRTPHCRLPTRLPRANFRTGSGGNEKKINKTISFLFVPSHGQKLCISSCAP